MRYRITEQNVGRICGYRIILGWKSSSAFGCLILTLLQVGGGGGRGRCVTLCRKVYILEEAHGFSLAFTTECTEY
jgi:hypothetical protein